MRHISRWDLDKTYLRTEFDTVRDLVRTAFERPDEKRTHPGAATLLREMSRSGVSIHILSGSPEQMRRRLEDKLRLDGIRWDTFTLKPNLQNMLRLRFRALRDQLGYKLPALLGARILGGEKVLGLSETLFGDDAEADAYVYSLYGDVMSGRVDADTLREICVRGRVYDDVMEQIIGFAGTVVKATEQVQGPSPEVVERVLIHLEQQTPPSDFRAYGQRVVPFYNYLQAAFVVHEDGRLSPDSVLRVAAELVTQHRFDGDSLARSYADVGRRGHLAGTKIADLEEAAGAWQKGEGNPAKDEIAAMVKALPAHAEDAKRRFSPPDETRVIDYLELVLGHNRRRSKRKH